MRYYRFNKEKYFVTFYKSASKNLRFISPPLTISPFTNPRFTNPRFTSPRLTNLRISPPLTIPPFTNQRFTSPPFTSASPRFTGNQSSFYKSNPVHL